MAITASQVKELRERTGAGMMECKKALVETDGDLDAAIDMMRKSGLAKADKKASRVAAEGIVAISISEDGSRGVMVEVNSETDFVAKNDEFVEFASQAAATVLANSPADVAALNEMSLNGGSNSVEGRRQELIAKLGENMTVRRFSVVDSQGGVIGFYSHGGRIGVMTALQGGDAVLAKDISMHVAASKPVALSEDDIPAEVLEKEKEVFIAQAQESGKPAEIIEKMIVGRMKKFVNEITLLGQPFVKDPDQTVAKLMDSNSAKILQFSRLEVGEGIEKKEENFADEVMAQVKG
ncbi:MAG: elongation factor Ts [Gammaproteobacteria bacterium]|jgi:elongation factor Ts|nr:elongation factor Ts [Gammaproteobacteria bacterium]MBT3490105.1 elongation factor Ts [Gammaproteobacteria bacterium]MBT3718595.1 elongation factor Ts [Gammaproteobacteria bacterium]MBT3844381.1 elongation factor Ts [Gammaproteobacteria bacterium]MBT3892578.1 elongation factor Ts [Gammaproteobacteria bacterium]